MSMVKFQKADIVRRAVILFYFFSEGGLKFKGLKEIVTSGPVDQKSLFCYMRSLYL